MNTGGAHQAIVGGNPCLSLPSSERLAPPPGTKLSILFTAQAFFGLPESLSAALAESPADWHWWIRVHPQYWETREPLRAELKRRGLRNWSLDDASDAPMAAALTSADVHVTEFSSSVLEAEALGIPSIVTHPKGGSLFMAQIESGIAEYATSGPMILDAVRGLLARRYAAETRPDPRKVFSDGCAWLTDVVREERSRVPAARSTKTADART
jgi:hypothetical protein